MSDSPSAREARLWALFDACLELDDAERHRHLAAEPDRALAHDVERLVRADAAPVDLPAVAGHALAHLVAPAPVIEGFTLLRVLGEGGFGTVYLALQHTPSRKVALKVLRPAAGDGRDAARFRFEGDALAALSHPHVPKVFAVGETAGRRWLAMELVRGERLDSWCASRPLRQRLEVLEAIARAVHVAHLRGLVHRDLKPENLLVTRDGTPRVLDFGIAQAIGDVAPAAGTHAYMSPEQRAGLAVDGRADVHALGVMLQQLAARAVEPGASPHTAATLLGGESAPGPLLPGPVEPSAPTRATPEPSEMTPAPRRLPAELESIAARATAPLTERYASAEAFADDLRRFCSGRRVQAHPATWGYRLRCTLRHSGGPLAGVGLVIAALTTTTFVFRAQVARAELERGRARAARDFLTATLVQANPVTGRGRHVTVVEAIDVAARRLDEGTLARHPIVEVDLRETLATTFASLGREVEAWRQAQRALDAFHRAGLDEPEQEARLLRATADFGAHAGALDTALEHLRRADALEAHHRPPHLHLAQQAHTLGEVLTDAGRFDEAIATFGQARAQLEALQHASASDPEALTSVLNQQAHALALVGRFAEARANFERALELDTGAHGPTHLEVATDLHNLAWLSLKEGDATTALEVAAKARALRLQALGPRHQRLGQLRLVEAEALAQVGRCEDAVAYADEGVSILREALGDEASRALRAVFVQARVLQRCERPSVSVVRPAVEALAARMGPTQWWVLEGRVVQARALVAEGQVDEGRASAREVVPWLEACLGPDAPLTGLARDTAKGLTDGR
jgi:eukaryotic-like serine/threonine-protein kinase